MALRIVAGTLRGRRIEAPAGAGTRPTADRVRQAIFDVLGQRLDGGVVLDLYAGSGAMGLEALSRGAASAVLVEQGRAAAAVCRRNAEALGSAPAVEILQADVLLALGRLHGQGRHFDLVFVDPPYETGPATALGALPPVLAAGARVVAEHDRRHPPGPLAGLTLLQTRFFGDTAVSFYETLEAEPR